MTGSHVLIVSVHGEQPRVYGPADYLEALRAMDEVVAAAGSVERPACVQLVQLLPFVLHPTKGAPWQDASPS